MFFVNCKKKLKEVKYIKNIIKINGYNNNTHFAKIKIFTFCEMNAKLILNLFL